MIFLTETKCKIRFFLLESIAKEKKWDKKCLEIMRSSYLDQVSLCDIEKSSLKFFEKEPRTILPFQVPPFIIIHDHFHFPNYCNCYIMITARLILFLGYVGPLASASLSL